MDPRVREGDKCGGGLTGTRDSDEGPFSRREEGWELGEEKEIKSLWTAFNADLVFE